MSDLRPAARTRRGKRRRAAEPLAPHVPAGLLAAALRAQSEGVFIAERGAGARGVKIIFANESFCAITGYSLSELVGRRHGSSLRHASQWTHKASRRVGTGHKRLSLGTSLA